MYSILYFSPIFIGLEFSRQIFEKSSNINYENPSSGDRVVSRVREDVETQRI